LKDLIFTTDLVTLFRHDKFYGMHKNLSVALRKFGLTSVERSDSIEKMFHALAVHVMDQEGETEPFLSETFIYPEAVIKLLKKHGLPIPAALQPASTSKTNHKGSIDQGQFEQYFDIVCRNCGTVTDPLAESYRTPVGRLIFKTYLETKLALGINTTARYVLEHLQDYDTEKVVTAVHEDHVTWKTEDAKEKITSLDTIAKRILNFNRELKTLL
jgi:hypothetical protein